MTTQSTGSKLAVVIPWFGRDLKGGAEQQAWQMASRLAARGRQVDVLTTCCRSFQDHWGQNHYPAGVGREQGLFIRRFPVRAGQFRDFNALNTHLLGLDRAMFRPGVSPVPGDAAEVFASDSIHSQGLLDHLRRHGPGYFAIIFLPYLYGPILNGLPLTAGNAYLMPCLHDEAYAYLPPVDRIFRQARGILYLSAGERELAHRLYGPGIMGKGVLVGAGVELMHKAEKRVDSRTLQRTGERFVLCLGRRDEHKNTDFLVQAFLLFRQRRPDTNLCLVLAGPGEKDYGGEGPGIVDLGLVAEADKAVLLSRCRALFQPSRNESYSRVIMEAWFCERPAAAHADCLATAIIVRDSGGGWLARSQEEWADLFTLVDTASEEDLAALGSLGRLYALDHASWDRVVDRYEEALGLHAVDQGGGATPAMSAAARDKRRSVHQVVAGFRLGDAISNYALAIQEQLRRLGFASEIYLPRQHLDPAARHLAQPYQDGCIAPEDGLIYHHSISSDLTPMARAHPGPKCLVYHNITPARFFLPYSDSRVRLLEEGRRELRDLASSFEASVGVSAYNATELAASGFRHPDVLPLIVDPGQWNTPPDPILMARFQDGRTNILFVGRVAPNKRQDRLIRSFAAFRDIDPLARLIFVGGFDLADPYYVQLDWMVAKYGLGDHVLFLGSIPDPGLQACYRTAHLFWSMSEHEGFGVPLIEAMWFDVPVLALNSAAVPETMGQAGAMFADPVDDLRLAALARALITDEELRQKVLAAQQQRRTAFVADRFQGRFGQVLESMGLKGRNSPQDLCAVQGRTYD